VTLLAPGALWWLLTALPVAAIFLYRRRVIEVEVPALTLWEQTRRRDTLGRWGRRLRRWLSLLVQLLIVLALVAALSEPVNPAHRTELLVVLDDSATMQTTEQDGQTRFDLARQIIVDRLRDKPTGARATVILAGTPPKIAVDRETVSQRVRNALSERQPRDVNPQIDAAVTLAQRKRQHDASKILVVSDRYDAQLAERADVEWLRVGEPHPNLAIEALASGAAGTTVEVLLTHRGMTATTATVSLFANEHEQIRRTVSLRERTTVVQLDAALTPGTPFQVRVEPPDAFPLDNTAFGVWPAPSNVRLQLVSSGSPFLEAALDQPGASLRILSPGEWPSDQTADVITLDSPVGRHQRPAGVPQEANRRVPGNFIIFDGDDPFGFTRTAAQPTNLTPSQWSADSLLLQDVDLLRWHIGQTASMVPPRFAEVAVYAGDVPLVFVVRDPGRADDPKDDFAAVYVNFALADGNVARRAGFPVFVWNAIDYLLDRRPEDARVAFTTGSPLPFPRQRQLEAHVTDPVGHDVQAFFDNDRLVVPFPEHAGFYQLDVAGTPVVRAANYVSDGVQTAGRPSELETPPMASRRPTWLASVPPWGLLAAIGGAILLLEALLFHWGVLKVS
jgi:hypothetical protein